MYTLKIEDEVNERLVIREYDNAKQAKRGFYSGVYNNPGCRVTLADPEGKVIRIGKGGKTVVSHSQH